LFGIVKFANMKKLLLLLAVVFASCEKEDICGEVVSQTISGHSPNYTYNYVIRDDEGNLHEVQNESGLPFSANDLGKVICID
jgi:hypothetical protein